MEEKVIPRMVRTILSEAHRITVDHGCAQIELAAVLMGVLLGGQEVAQASRSMGYDPLALLDALEGTLPTGQFRGGRLDLSDDATQVMTIAAELIGRDMDPGDMILATAFARYSWFTSTPILAEWHRDLRRLYGGIDVGN